VLRVCGVEDLQTVSIER